MALIVLCLVFRQYLTSWTDCWTQRWSYRYNHHCRHHCCQRYNKSTSFPFMQVLYHTVFMYFLDFYVIFFCFFLL